MNWTELKDELRRSPRPSLTTRRLGSIVWWLAILICVFTIGRAVDASSAPSVGCPGLPTGIVSWWRGESNALDSVGTNHGMLENGLGFFPGKVGYDFNFDGIDDFVFIPASASLDVGLSSGFTLEGWINPIDPARSMAIFEYERGLGTFSGNDVGVQFYVSGGGSGPGTLSANVKDTSGGDHMFSSGPNLVTAGAWQHAALTYDKASGVAVIYLNGVALFQTNAGSFTPQTSFDLLVGARTTFNSVTAPSETFRGQMDELSLYNRALTPAEINGIFDSGSAGKCPPAPPPQITGADAQVVEGNSGHTNLTFTLTLSASNSQPVTVQYQTVDGTAHAPADYLATNGIVTFSPGQTSAVVLVVVLSGTQLELDETLTLNLFNPTNATLARTNLTGTIVDDDRPCVSIGDTVAYEGDVAVFTLTLSGTPPPGGYPPISVDYAASNGTATAKSDYEVDQGSRVTFSPGMSMTNVYIRINTDLEVESNETFYVYLFPTPTAKICGSPCVCVILDRTVPPTLTVSDAQTVEGNSGSRVMTFTATLSRASPQTISFDFTTADGTALGGSDYISTNGTVVLQPGSISTNFSVLVLGDTQSEPDETFFVQLTNPQLARLATNSVTGTILDDDCSGNLTATPLTNQTACACEAVVFSTSVSSPDPVTFLWRANGVLIPGQTRSNLLLQSLTPEHSGVYSVEIATSCQRLTNSATLTVKSAPPTPLVLSNSTPITINDLTAASPYPSTIDVSCVPGPVKRVTVSLFGLSHTSTHDVDILVANPANQGVKLMSDLGRSAANVDLTFSDSATLSIPGFPGDIVSGIYKPSDIGVASDDAFPNTISLLPNLAGFNAASPNGTWGLYVRDDESLDTGMIARGWSLSIDWDDSAPRLASLTNLFDGHFRIVLVSQKGKTHQIEASSDLHTWLPVSTYVMVGTNLPITITIDEMSPRRFFRVVRCPNLDF